MSIATTTFRVLLGAMYRALDPLCEQTSSAVRIAVVPNGTEYRFVVLIDERWRSEVYSLIAERTSISIPADGGPLNLSLQQARELSELGADAEVLPEVPAPATASVRLPRRMPDLRGGAIEHTFQ
jgi:hypothetical protein